LIRADLTIEAERTGRLQQLVQREFALAPAQFEAGSTPSNANCRSTASTSCRSPWFAKREPMRGDLHQLFACESRCNSFRGNFPYFDFADFQQVVRDTCGQREDAGFEPAAGKGPVAPATLYFLLRYPGEVGDETRELQHGRVGLLLDWHRAEPVGDYERHRNAAIAELQGNRNPLIDHPDWSERIDFDASFRT
jgi:endonuclease G, mitochondrial